MEMESIMLPKNKTQQPLVAVIILNWNGKEDTIKCLDSLKSLEYKNYEVILVDNGSSDGSVEYFKEHYPHVILLENRKNLGYSEGNNVGMRLALERGADYLFLLNNDATVEAKCLSELVRVAEEHPKAGVLGPKTYVMGSNSIIYIVGIKMNYKRGCTYDIGMGETDTGQYEDITAFDVINGHAFMIKRKVIDQIGLLDSGYFAYFEELDFCVRAAKKGFKMLYVPSAIAWHKGESSGTSYLRQYLLQRNQLRFMRKNAPVAQLLHFYLYFIAYALPKRIIKHIVKRDAEGLFILLQAVGWNFGLFKKNNILSKSA